MSENKLDLIEDWYYLFDDADATFIAPDGSPLKIKNVESNQIENVLYQHEESDSWDWSGAALVELKGGNFAYLTGWSETTFSGAQHFIAESLETLFKYGMSPEEEKTIRATL